ncbi:MAG: transposase, partial [Hungatella sp.]
GAKELDQILEYETLPDKLKVFLNNYKIHVLEIRSFHDIDRFKTDLREVFGFIQRSGNPAEEQ